MSELLEKIQIGYDKTFKISIGIYSFLILSSIISMFVFGSGNYPLILNWVVILLLIWLYVQPKEELKAKYVNNRFLVASIFGYFTFVFHMFAAGREVFVTEVILFTAIYGLWAISLNMSTGIVGILNFGVIAQVAVGAVFVGIATLNGWPILIATIVGMILAGLFSALLAYTTVRLRDDYFAIVSITVGEIIRQVLNSEKTLRAARSLPPGQKYPRTPGILDIYQPFTGVFHWLTTFTPFKPDEYRIFLGILGFVLLMGTYFFADYLFNSPIGRILRAIREDSEVTESYGKNILWYKVLIMFLSGAVAGLGGALYGWASVSLFPNSFLPLFTFYIWVAFIVGGRGNNKGMIVGGMLFVLLERTSRFLNDPSNPFFMWLNTRVTSINPNVGSIALGSVQLIAVGLVLIVFLRFAPRGIIPEEPYEPDIAGYSLPNRGSQADTQQIEKGGKSNE